MSDEDSLRAEAEAQLALVEDLFKRPHIMDIICSHVSNGGAITELCEAFKVEYGALMNFINARPQYYSKLGQAQISRTEWTIERILNELRRIALCDVRQLFTSTGELLPPNEWPEDAAKAVSSIEIFEVTKGDMKLGDTKKLKLWDKLKAIELLGKNLGLFVNRHQVSTGDTLEKLVAGSYEVEYEKQ